MLRNIRNVERFTPDSRSRAPQVTVRWSSQFSFGASLQRQFQNKNIELGYWSEEKALIVYEVDQGGYSLPKHGRIFISRLVRRIHQEGITLPARFLFAEEEPGIWVGTLDIRQKVFHHKATKKVSMVPELALEGYGWIIDKTVSMCAKTTPIAERRNLATQALLKAAFEYVERDGPLREYLLDKVKTELVVENKQHTKGYKDMRLDKLMENSSGDSFSAHEVMPDADTSSLIGTIEDRIADAHFAATCLNEQERMIFNMLNRGYATRAIIKRCQIEPERLYEMCEEIGNKRKVFLSAG